VLTFGQDTVQSADAASTQQVEEESFDVVVLMVRGGDVVVLLGCEQFREPFVAQRAGGVLDSEMVLFGESVRVELFDEERDMVLRCQIAHESLVGVGFFASQTEVAVGYAERETGLMEEVRHYR